MKIAMTLTGLTFIGLIVLFIVGINKCTDEVASKIKAEKANYEKNLGKKVLIDKDSLTIIDYNSLTHTYKLSNGKDISMKFVK